MIKGMPITPAVIGQISIGKVVEKNGKRLPEKDDCFAITAQVKQEDGWLLHPLHQVLADRSPNKKIHSIRPLINLCRALCAVLLILPAVATSQTAGQYRCWSYNVSGGGGSCRLAPPLVLNSDGTYQMSSEKGTYKVQDGRLVLSESKIRGPGKLQGGNRIIFEYDYKGMRHTVTYACQSCAGGK